MVGESDQNVFLIQIDASSFAEFEIFEFEISRVDCTCCLVIENDEYLSDGDYVYLQRSSCRGKMGYK